MKFKEFVTLLGVKIDYKLSLESHISKLCLRAATQLNALKRLGSLWVRTFAKLWYHRLTNWLMFLFGQIQSPK